MDTLTKNGKFLQICVKLKKGTIFPLTFIPVYWIRNSLHGNSLIKLKKKLHYRSVTGQHYPERGLFFYTTVNYTVHQQESRPILCSETGPGGRRKTFL